MNYLKKYSDGWVLITEGCGCCSEDMPVTKELLQEHLEEINRELSLTKQLLETGEAIE